jgi:hypothetical protein
MKRSKKHTKVALYNGPQTFLLVESIKHLIDVINSNINEKNVYFKSIVDAEEIHFNIPNIIIPLSGSPIKKRLSH